ncbi:ACP phosphodiesterase [Silvimonas soli]|uniref:acyl carrier protein phosphodiesterase n=1 Tax=Silvimonas soli TaxID=2980100 RepID=UPI0024B368AA|nr:ACP phosphodiesterase [Silvimonas soli]
MNYLAHLLLAGPAPAYRLGGLLGDFVKGPLPGQLAEPLAAGVALHRSIDVFADEPPAFLASRARVSALRRRYSGIMVDMFYDHFLAARWSEFSDQALPDFANDTYTLLRANQTVLPERLAQILPHMQQYDWLTSYREVASITRAIDNMATRRLSRPNPMVGGGEELIEQYQGFEADFLAFWPDVLHHSEQWRRAYTRNGLPL